MKDPKKVKQGKRNLQRGRRFERKTRKDLESKGWIVSKWQNNIEWNEENINRPPEKRTGKCVAAKQGRFRKTSTGFPDFVAWHKNLNLEVKKQLEEKKHHCVGTFGVECKTNGYLSQEEKEKCRWYLDNHIFSKILIAYKVKDPNDGRKRLVKYKEFREYDGGKRYGQEKSEGGKTS